VKLSREPLVHFLLLGALMFVVYGLVSDRAGSELAPIVVTPGKIDNLAATFSRTWQRPPTEQELGGLIEDYIREEVFCREAMALGLDREDTVIRRRLRQKMEFISDDVTVLEEPDDDELRAYLAKNPDAFLVEQRSTFRHVHLDPDRRGDALDADIERLLGELNGLSDTADVVGDSLLLDTEFESLAQRDVAGMFGDAFAAQLATLPIGHWVGPVASGYGVHLVLVQERTAGRVPSLQEVRAAVVREWSRARRVEANEEFYQGLLKRYTVIVERSQPTDRGDEVAEARP